jgi:hypothetical protein
MPPAPKALEMSDKLIDAQGYNSFGLSLLPLLFGIGLLFFNGRSILGWLLLLIGAAIIFATTD